MVDEGRSHLAIGKHRHSYSKAKDQRQPALSKPVAGKTSDCAKMLEVRLPVAITRSVWTSVDPWQSSTEVRLQLDGRLRRIQTNKTFFLGGPTQLAQQQLRRKLKAVRRLCRSVLLGVSCTLATSLGYSKSGGLQQLCELVDKSMGR